VRGTHEDASRSMGAEDIPLEELKRRAAAMAKAAEKA